MAGLGAECQGAQGPGDVGGGHGGCRACQSNMWCCCDSHICYNWCGCSFQFAPGHIPPRGKAGAGAGPPGAKGDGACASLRAQKPPPTDAADATPTGAAYDDDSVCPTETSGRCRGGAALPSSATSATPAGFDHPHAAHTFATPALGGISCINRVRSSKSPARITRTALEFSTRFAQGRVASGTRLDPPPPSAPVPGLFRNGLAEVQGEE